MIWQQWAFLGLFAFFGTVAIASNAKKSNASGAVASLVIWGGMAALVLTI